MAEWVNEYRADNLCHWEILSYNLTNDYASHIWQLHKTLLTQADYAELLLIKLFTILLSSIMIRWIICWRKD